MAKRLYDEGTAVSSDPNACQPSPPERQEKLLWLAVELLGDLLRSTPSSMDETLASVLQELGHNHLFDHGFVYRVCNAKGDGPLAKSQQWSGTVERERPEALAEQVLSLLRTHGLIDGPLEISVRNAVVHGVDLSAQLKRLDLATLLLIPLCGPAGCLGCVGFGNAQPDRSFTEPEIKLLHSLADAMGAAMIRANDALDLANARAEITQSHDRLKTTLGALSELVLEVDSAGRYVGVYTADEAQMMVSPQDLIGKLHEEVMPAEIAALNRRAMAEVDETGRAGPHPFWADTPRGRRRYTVTVTPRAPDRPGGESGYVFVARDTTEEWRLATKAERLGLIAHRMTDLVMVIGVDSRIEWVNPAFEARTGWSLDEVRGRTPSSVLHANATDQTEVRRVDAEMTAGRPIRTELLNRTRNGELFWTEIDMQPLRDNKGRLTGYVSIETDITERKQHAEALERLAREATEARARLEMAVEALPDAFVYFDAEDRLVLCNTRYRGMFRHFGHRIENGSHFEDVTRALALSGEVPDAVGSEDEWVAQRLEDHQKATGSYDHKIGGKWVRSIERETPDGGRVGMRIDITEVKNAERRLADIIYGAQAGTWEWHIPLGENHINERWAEIVGYTIEELAPLTIGTWERLVEPADLVAAKSKLEQVFARKVDQFEYELRMRHKDGHWVWVMSRGRVARWSHDGKPEIMAGVHIDITALKRAEDRLEEIIDAAEAGTWELDLITGNKRVNERWTEMMGYTPDELAHLPHFGFRDLIHPDDLDLLIQQHHTLLNHENDRFANEIRMRHKDGHWIWILSRGRVTLRDETGQPLKLAGIHLDITERMRLQSQLTAERDYLARLMDTSVSGITALDESGHIMFANRGAENILGLSASAIRGTRYDDPFWNIAALDGTPLDVDALPFKRVMAEGSSVRNIRFSIGWPDGTRRMLSVNAAPINAEGLSVRVVCSIIDITEQVSAEKKLRDAAEKAEMANRSKSLFLANMSHEIRTPLNGVLGMAQILESEISDARQLEMLATIRMSGESLLQVLNDVLDMSKIEAGKLTLERDTFNPGEIARQIESVHNVIAHEKNLTLHVSIEPRANALRLGDPGRIAQILHNLIGNAIKFTETGDVRLTIGVDEADALLLRIEDTGIGMTDEQVARVFEDFEQADGTVTRRFGGTGLGMSIVKRLVELMGGKITVSSALNVGTEVTVTLPLAMGKELTAATKPGATGSVVGLRVLAADDNHTNRIILGSMMAKLGVNVVLAEDGRAAVNAWEADRFDLYLLDISMPELDGIGALSELRARERQAGQSARPAIALTANVMSHQVEEYARAGFTSYLGKPFRRDDLLTEMSKAMSLCCKADH